MAAKAIETQLLSAQGTQVTVYFIPTVVSGYRRRIKEFISPVKPKATCDIRAYCPMPNPNISPVGAGTALRILINKRNMVFYGRNEKVQFVPRARADW